MTVHLRRLTRDAGRNVGDVDDHAWRTGEAEVVKPGSPAHPGQKFDNTDKHPRSGYSSLLVRAELRPRAVGRSSVSKRYVPVFRFARYEGSSRLDLETSAALDMTFHRSGGRAHGWRVAVCWRCPALQYVVNSAVASCGDQAGGEGRDLDVGGLAVL